jgi:(p)ppGpp synthase/HD superfamily hydrolase
VSAVIFVQLAPAAQRREGIDQEPYINHLLEVAVTEATGGPDPTVVIASLLHDAIEDQGVKPATIASEFGQRVADIVMEVTDDKSLPKAERKRKQVENAPKKSREAKLIKLADKTSNLREPWQAAPHLTGRSSDGLNMSIGRKKSSRACVARRRGSNSSLMMLHEMPSGRSTRRWRGLPGS